MYDLAQVAVKLVLIGATLLVALIISIRVWRSDLDLRQLLNPRRMVQRAVDAKVDWIPKREFNAIYQDGKVVAKVSGAIADDRHSRIAFEEIYNSATLDLGREFEYQKWRLRFAGAESLTGMLSSAPEKGQIIGKAVCEILGERPPL